MNLAQMSSDMAFMVSDLPTAVTWGSQTFNAVVSDIGNTDSLEIPGVTEQAQLSVDYLLSAVTGSISQDAEITIGGVVYRVAKANISPDGITGRLECVGGEE